MVAGPLEDKVAIEKVQEVIGTHPVEDSRN